MGGRGSTRWNYRGDYVPPLTIVEAMEIRASSLFKVLCPQEGRRQDAQLSCSSAPNRLHHRRHYIASHALPTVL